MKHLLTLTAATLLVPSAYALTGTENTCWEHVGDLNDTVDYDIPVYIEASTDIPAFTICNTPLTDKIVVTKPVQACPEGTNKKIRIWANNPVSDETKAAWHWEPSASYLEGEVLKLTYQSNDASVPPQTFTIDTNTIQYNTWTPFDLTIQDNGAGGLLIASTLSDSNIGESTIPLVIGLTKDTSIPVICEKSPTGEPGEPNVPTPNPTTPKPIEVTPEYGVNQFGGGSPSVLFLLALAALIPLKSTRAADIFVTGSVGAARLAPINNITGSGEDSIVPMIGAGIGLSESNFSVEIRAYKPLMDAAINGHDNIGYQAIGLVLGYNIKGVFAGFNAQLVDTSREDFVIDGAKGIGYSAGIGPVRYTYLAQDFQILSYDFKYVRNSSKEIVLDTPPTMPVQFQAKVEEPVPTPEQFTPGLHLLVLFNYDNAELDSADYEAIKHYLPMIMNSNKNIVITGMCSEEGSEEYNDALGQRRAQAMADALISFGIDRNRLILVSVGEREQLSLDDPELNRNVTVTFQQ